MTLAVTFHRAARIEFIEAAAWYEAQLPNLGIEFIAEVDRCISLIAEYPHFYTVVYKGLRRIITKRFPYSIYFRVETEHIVVLAVFHGSRNPIIWQSRD